MKTKIFIKDKNALEIDKHIKNAFNSAIQGTKLFALMKLIDLKGETVTANEEESINGTKVIEYKKGFYIGFKKTLYANKSMQLKTIIFQSI